MTDRLAGSIGHHDATSAREDGEKNETSFARRPEIMSGGWCGACAQSMRISIDP